MANLNSNGTGKEPGFLDHMKGALLTAFGMTPLGTALGLNPIINRPLVRTGINETTKDTVRDVGLAYKYLATFGDKQAANKTADEIEQIWRKNITQNAGMGQSEFRLGAGWKMPANTLYNGKIDKEREGKDLPVDAVFLRHKNGSIEVLDHSDPRYAELAMPYVIGQLAIPIGAGKAMAAIKFLSNGGKIVDGIVKGAELAGKTVSAVNTLGGLGYVGSMAANKLILTPDSINRVAHLFDNPNNFKPDNLREELNSIFEKYSYLNGPMSEQYYVPEVKPGQSPWQRLQDLSTGFAHRVFKSTTPFDRIEDLSDKSKHFCESVDLSEATAEIVRSIDFQRGFLKLAQKSLSGVEMSHQEIIMLKFGMNIFASTAEQIMPKNGESFSAAEKKKLNEDLQKNLSVSLFPGEDKVPLSKIKQEISDIVGDLDKRINKRDGSILRNRLDSPFGLG